ncbi:MAG TPA: 3-oxoadipate enol-lactonase [Verrucomicrobiae bacterium]|nr:3-oxoadipate enol-lactonase [Verrucomicrobiae bacterium]
MPFATVDKARLFYRLEGRSDLPVLVLSHSLGCDHGMWAPQMPELLEHYQVLRYDTRGHGASDAPAGDYSIEQMARDVLALADALGLKTFNFCGLSMGGAIGQWLAIHAPERLRALVLANTSAQFSSEILEARRKAVLQDGMSSVVDAAMGRFFMPETLARGGPYTQSIRSVFLGSNPQGYAGCCAAIRDVNHKSGLAKIHAPTLVIVGDHDASTPWTGHGDLLASGIPGAKAVHLPTAHLSNLEQPGSFVAAVLEFLLATKP